MKKVIRDIFLMLMFNTQKEYMNFIMTYSTVDLDCDLEKISKKLKFGIDVPYAFRIHQRKIPTHSNLGTTKIHNGGFTAFFLHFNLKNHKYIISYVILCANIRFCFKYLLLPFECQYSNRTLWF